MRFFTCLFLFIFLFSCGSDNSQSGVISETSNGAIISGTLLSENQQLVPYHKVNLRPADYTFSDSSEFHTYACTTDDSGNYTFNDIPVGRYVIESSDKQSTFFEYCIVSIVDSLKEIGNSLMTPSKQFSGFVDAFDLKYVDILGLHLSSTVSSSGGFEFSNIPEGELLFRFSGTSIEQDVPSVLFKNDTSIITVSLDSIATLHLDNFDDGNSKHLLYPFRTRGQWYAKEYSFIDAIPSDLASNFSSAIKDSSAWSGKSCFVSFSFTPEAPKDATPFIGIEFGSGATGSPVEARWHDLSFMEELSFMAKGTGTLRIGFISKVIRDNYGGASHFQDSIVLSDTWTRYSIIPANINPPLESDASNDGISWDDGKDQVAEITFFAMEDISFALDDIKLVGIKDGDFLTPYF